jgi:hypothetical protein
MSPSPGDHHVLKIYCIHNPFLSCQYRATSDHLFSVVLDRRRDEARFLRWNGGKAAKKHPKARAHRAWRRNAERMQRNWTLSL